MKEKNYPVVVLNVANEESQGKGLLIDPNHFQESILEELDQFIGFINEFVKFLCV
jgi:hypothetical protein